MSENPWPIRGALPCPWPRPWLRGACGRCAGPRLGAEARACLSSPLRAPEGERGVSVRVTWSRKEGREHDVFVTFRAFSSNTVHGSRELLSIAKSLGTDSTRSGTVTESADCTELCTALLFHENLVRLSPRLATLRLDDARWRPPGAPTALGPGYDLARRALHTQPPQPTPFGYIIDGGRVSPQALRSPHSSFLSEGRKRKTARPNTDRGADTCWRPDDV